MPTNYVAVDSPMVSVESDHITIEGADISVSAIKPKATRVEDYLGIGNPLIYR